MTVLFPGNGNYTLAVYGSVTGNSISVNMYVERMAGSGYYTADPQPWAITIDGQNFYGNWTYDFRSGANPKLVGSATATVSGTGSKHFQGWVTMDNSFGTATEGAYLTVAGVPPAPSMSAFTPNPDQVTQTQMRVRFASTGDGGSPITGYELQRATNASFTAGAVTVPSTGTFTASGLSPATTYYFRARATNAVGTGAWSSTVSATTLPSVAPGISVSPSLSGTSATITLTPPGGVGGVLSYTLERRIAGGAITSVTGSSPFVITGLTPGTAYEWRARANFSGGGTSPYTGWVTIFQPNPNTNPGDYFDGATAARTDVTFGWTGTVNNSISSGVGKHATGWATFAQGASVSGGTGAQQRVAGAIARWPEGQVSGTYSARYTFFSDCTAAGFRAGIAQALALAPPTNAGGVYQGSIFALPSRSQRLACQISWYNAAGSLLSRTIGTPQVVTPDAPIRLLHSATCPADGFATVAAIDVTGAGWSLWLGGQTITVDGGMLTVGASSVMPYFDGATPASAEWLYEWVGTAQESQSRRIEIPAGAYDPLADPDCPAPPTPPAPPAIEDECVTEVGVWRRYWAVVDAANVTAWLTQLPTLTISTGGFPARQVRVRYYENPGADTVMSFEPGAWAAEQVIRFIPADTAFTLDGVSERARASVAGAPAIPADHLIYGPGGGGAQWPSLSCGIGYLIALDVPLDAPLGNLTIALSLTEATM